MSMPLDLDALTEAAARGECFKYVFFWSGVPKAKTPGPWVFSQWYQDPFEADGVTYGSAEHYMMAGKARLFKDEETLQKILAADHPAEVKKLGRQVRGFKGEVWNDHRMEIVTQGNIAKFGADPALREYLVGTKDRVLVEASPKDRIWGIGLAEEDERAQNPLTWKGLNLLGFALMQARLALSKG